MMVMIHDTRYKALWPCLSHVLGSIAAPALRRNQMFAIYFILQYSVIFQTCLMATESSILYSRFYNHFITCASSRGLQAYAGFGNGGPDSERNPLTPLYPRPILGNLP